MRALGAALALLVPFGASAQRFEQGPGQIGAQRDLMGKVIGIHGDCAVVLADTNRPGWEGMGGGGRFFHCAPGLQMAEQIKALGVQEGTRQARVGPRWRVLAVYYPVAR